jgi:hypothetical protein
MISDPDRLYSFPGITLTESPGVLTRQSLCVSLSPSVPVGEGYTIAVAWNDVPGHPGVNPSLVNDVDMVVITDRPDVWWGEDGVHAHERVTNVHADRYIRMVFFPYDNATTDRAIRVFAHANFSISHTTVITNVTLCGTCLPGETEECVTTGGLSGLRYCQLHGHFSDCHVSALPLPRRENSMYMNVTSCNNTHPSQISRVDNDTTCEVVECESGYVFDTTSSPETCICVPDTFQENCNEPDMHLFRACVEDGTYGMCPDEFHQDVTLIKASSAVRRGEDKIPTWFILMVSLLLLV